MSSRSLRGRVRLEGHCTIPTGELASGPQMDLRAVSGGHDWAWWVPELLDELIDLFPADGNQGS